MWEHKATGGRVSLLLKTQDTECFALEFKTTAATLDVDFYLRHNHSKEKTSRPGPTAIAMDCWYLERVDVQMEGMMKG